MYPKFSLPPVKELKLDCRYEIVYHDEKGFTREYFRDTMLGHGFSIFLRILPFALYHRRP